MYFIMYFKAIQIYIINKINIYSKMNNLVYQLPFFFYYFFKIKNKVNKRIKNFFKIFYIEFIIN